MKKLYLFILFGFMVVFTESASASVLTPTQNLYDSSQANYLINMANNQIDNFTNCDFVILQVDNDYYLISSKNVVVNNDSLILNDSTIIHAVRNQSGSYYSNYSYVVYSESSTSVYLSSLVISNIKANNTLYSSTFDDLKFHTDLRNVGIFVLAFCFGLFLLKERSY